jgi:hypothetical protein
VDARHKAGHDAFRYKAPFHWLHFESDSQDEGVLAVTFADVRKFASMMPTSSLRANGSAQRAARWLLAMTAREVSYRTTPEVKPALRRGGLMSFFRKQWAWRPIYPGRA